MDHIYIGHDSTGVGDSWYLESVVIATPAAGIEQTFDHGDWIKQDKKSSAMVKLRENKTKRKIQKQKPNPHQKDRIKTKWPFQYTV